MLTRRRKARLEAKARQAAFQAYVVADRRAPVSELAGQLLRKAFPDHWSFLLGEIALYGFVILVLTGSYLTLFFDPSLAEVTYHGSYEPLRGLLVTKAFESTLHVSFDVRGGLLIRQMHHWAALVFVAAIGVHMLRIFFTGAFRRPRELNWVIGLTLFLLALLEGFGGYSLPGDLLSGTGLRTANTIVMSIPVVGTYLAFFLWGGSYPGTVLNQRLYIVHVLFVPGLMIGLIAVHLILVVYLKHTQWAAPGRTNRNVVGHTMVPSFAARSVGLSLMVFGSTALLGGVAQINPVWNYGPYVPDQVSTGAQPDWYVGFLEGALRLMPPLETNVAGHTFMWNVLLPAVVLPALLFMGLYLYPFFERWLTGDLVEHHLCDRPRDRPVRTGLGVAGIVFYAVLLLAGGNDVIAYLFDVSVNVLTWVFRVAVIVGPIMAYLLTRRVCLALQLHERQLYRHGEETGVVRQDLAGGMGERHVGLDRERRYRLLAREIPRPMKHPGPQAPLRRRLRASLSSWYYRDRVELPTTAEERLQITGRTADPVSGGVDTER
ncbi:cytochrome b [Streptomyces colonosanans]|uniref:Cytochrome bc1 complex cytochrome b subunit n=1 Tax=Streptomyces colonosanans TaxID=1428652 RepID=A0A1S2Q4D3_9ACTN|nr:cytochrome bc complex cytochrome b subunit [Streptomyces colonosanans]OIK00999.1 ubiquinol-cytochrome c reductase cytochrome b subunit [Streptomyces colonosanans]